jgi:hypothetical protein
MHVVCYDTVVRSWLRGQALFHVEQGEDFAILDISLCFT